MKTSILLSLAIFLLASCTANKSLVLTNDSSFDLTDKTIVLSRAELMVYTGDSIAGEVVAKKETGEWLPTQYDDLDGDGSWDEMAFLCDIRAGEKIRILFEKPPSPVEFPKRTNVRFGRMSPPFDEVSGDLRMKTNDTKYTAPVYQMEGPAWENEFIAFRNYYDARNGMDIFGKTIHEMVLDSVGVNGRDYHTLADWGMDILKVGNSLGAGSIAIGVGDSLYRIGPCEEGTYRMIAEGPVRAVLEFEYKGVPAGDRTYDVRHRIILNAGDRFYRNNVWISNLRGDESLVTGIVDLHNVPSDTTKINREDVLYALGNQGFSGELLGMAVIFPDSQLIAFDKAPVEGNGIVNTHLVKLRLYQNDPSNYGFMAVWENESPGIKDPEYFKQLILEAANR